VLEISSSIGGDCGLGRNRFGRMAREGLLEVSEEIRGISTGCSFYVVFLSPSSNIQASQEYFLHIKLQATC
jgi:hypothetical protein